MPAPDFLPLPRVSHPKPPAQTDGLPTLPGPCVCHDLAGALREPDIATRVHLHTARTTHSGPRVG